MESVPCHCSNFNPSFVDQHHKHILTGDLNILGNIKLIDLFSKGPKFREPATIDWDDARRHIVSAIRDYIEKISSYRHLQTSVFQEWKTTIMNLLDNKIAELRNRSSQRNHTQFYQITFAKSY